MQQFVGIDWATRRARWCAVTPAGAVIDEGWTPADEDGLARLVGHLGSEALACMEMMSGAAWVRDRLRAGGWTVQIADARKAKAVGSLAAKTDKLDARVLAELARRDLVPQVYVATFPDRELKERLGRRMHMIRLRTSAINRAHGVLSQFGVKLAFDRLREPDALELLAERGVPEVWRRSVGETVAIVRVLDERLIPIEQELRPIARRRAGRAAGHDPGDRRSARPDDRQRDRRHLAVRVGAQARRVLRADAAGLPVRREVAHRQAVEVRLDDAALGRDRGRAAGVAPEQPLAPALPRRQGALRRQGQPRQGRRRPQGPDRQLARPVPPAALHPFAPARRDSSCPGELQLRSGRLNGPQGIEQPGQLQPTRCAKPSAERELSSNRTHDPKGRARPTTP